jgi:hypothetical protein
MKKQKIYYSIRVVRGTSKEDAVENVIHQHFIESDSLCDAVLTREQLEIELKKCK